MAGKAESGVRFVASPGRRCFAPGRTFPSAQQALDFASEASKKYGLPYACWRVEGKRIRLLTVYRPFLPAA